MGKGISVLDTNVLLGGGVEIFNFFTGHLVIIPMSVVVELDRFKKGGKVENRNARSVIRFLDGLRNDEKLFSKEGAYIEKLNVRIGIVSEKEDHSNLKKTIWFSDGDPDDRILNVAYCLHENFPKHEVILWTQDLGLRLKASFVGVLSDYVPENVLSDKADASLYTGFRSVEVLDSKLINQFWEDKLDSRSLEVDLRQNEYLSLNNGGEEFGLGVVRGNKVYKVKSDRKVFGISPLNSEQACATDALINPDIPAVFIEGKAGTGKTLLALAAALESRRSYRQILIVRPIVPLENKEMGFLPGDVNAKVGPYTSPIYDNLDFIRHNLDKKDKRQKCLERLWEDSKIVVEPLPFIRGRSLRRVFVIVDESQNLTSKEFKAIITRVGEGTKIVFTGDASQSDIPDGKNGNSMLYVMDRLCGDKLVSHVKLREVRRSRLTELAADRL